MKSSEIVVKKTSPFKVEGRHNFTSKLYTSDYFFTIKDSTTICYALFELYIYLYSTPFVYTIETKGFSKCHQHDTYNKSYGERLAFSRAKRLALMELKKMVKHDFESINNTTNRCNNKLNAMLDREKDRIKELKNIL